MPFKPIKHGKNKGKYKTPGGRVYTARQVKAYHATQAWSKPVRKSKRKSK